MKTQQSQSTPPAAGEAENTPYFIHVFTGRRALARKDSGGCIKIVATISDHVDRAEQKFIVRACNGFDQLVTLAQSVANEQNSPYRKQALEILSRL